MTDIVELPSDDLVEIADERKSILGAAATAQNIAMLTGTHGVVAPPLLRPRARLPKPSEIKEGTRDDAEDVELARLEAFVASRTDAVAQVRAHLELARAYLERGRLDDARRAATEATKCASHTPAAHALLRVLFWGRDTINEQLEHVDRLVADAAGGARADWLAERARLLEARDGVTSASVATWSEALAAVPDHSGALYGAEAAFDATGRHAEQVALLARLADLLGPTEEAAWIHVERALLLDRKLDAADDARAALARALELAPGIGAVRGACTDHAVRHRDDARLAVLLEAEAMLEKDLRRAAVLDLDAALAHRRAGTDRAHVVKLLERAHARVPGDARIADELAREYDDASDSGGALRTRKAALRGVSDPREEAVALRAIAATARRANDVDAAVLALERARVLEADDATLLGDLDRLLAQAERHEARAVLWMREAARVEDGNKKARALLASAEAAAAAGRTNEAAKQREAAWLTQPNAAGVYDALAERIAPIAPTSAVQERIGLYRQAVVATTDPDRKIHFLEKMAWLADDVAGEPNAAAKLYEEILSIEPMRLSAIMGLASVATRAGDAKALARALLAQADITSQGAQRSELRVRAAEALAAVDAERALALAEDLLDEAPVRSRAYELVTRLHVDAGRWDRAADTFARRAADSSEEGQRVAFVLSEAEVLLDHVHAPDRALAALARITTDDAAIRAMTLVALEALGDDARLRSELGKLAERAEGPARSRLLVRAAELDEAHARDADAVRAYERAYAADPESVLVLERLRRIGARAALGSDSLALVSPLRAAVRAIDVGETHGAEPLLATGNRDIATLRMAERLARRAGSAPQLANALALSAELDGGKSILGKRAYEGLAVLLAWTLPANDDLEPWDRLLALGTTDASVLDLLAFRARTKDDAAAIRALVRRIETTTDTTERLMAQIDLVRVRRRAVEVAEAGGECKRALVTDGASLSAACLLAEIAVELDDDEAAILASRALAEIVVSRKARAELLRDASDLAVARRDSKLAAELLEQALRANPENVEVAARLADLQRTRGAFAELSAALRDALGAARGPEAIVPIASELADVAKNNLKDPAVAIFALERVREVSPKHLPSLLLLAELFIGQRAWDKALQALAEAAAASSEANDKLVALVGRASIYRRVLGDPANAEKELRAALVIDAHDGRVIRGLLDLGAHIPAEERTLLLGRLVAGDMPMGERLGALLELADARRAAGDIGGAEGALVEAASLQPNAAMLERIRKVIQDKATLASVLSRAVGRAHELSRPIDPAWLVTLGAIELDLGRVEESIDRFEEALRADPSRDEARIALARALALHGRHELAVEAFGPVIAARRLPIDPSLVRLLERSLAGAGRGAEQRVARELRAVAGDLQAHEQAELDTRTKQAAPAEGLSVASLRRSVMPNGVGRHPIWDVAGIAGTFAGKLAQIKLAELGSSSRERVKPRAAHPVRPLFDRVQHALELQDVELAVSDHVTVPVIACEDVPWVIVPSAVGALDDARAIAAIARPMTRIALGVPWFGSLQAHEVLAILVAFARLVSPSFSAKPEPYIEPLVEDYAQKSKRAIDRRRRRLLEELEPTLDAAPPIDAATFADAVACTEARVAFLLSGSLRASLDAVAGADAGLAAALRTPGAPSLATIFDSASSRDLAWFALNGETTALRRSLGAV